jgi:hypothetical protein
LVPSECPDWIVDDCARDRTRANPLDRARCRVVAHRMAQARTNGRFGGAIT